MKPTILQAIDALIPNTLPAGIRAWGDDVTMAAVRAYADEQEQPEPGEDAPPLVPADPFMRQWWYRGVEVMVTTTLDWGTRVIPGFDRPTEQPRDPETGRFISYEDAANG